jgi:hypothetical protein
MNNKQCRVTVWALLLCFIASNVAGPAFAGPFQDRGGGGGGGQAAAPRGAWAQARAAGGGAGGGGGVMPMSAPMATAGITGGFQANHAAMQAQAALTATNAAAAMQSALPNNFPLDLSAIAANIAANVSQPTNILVGGTARFNGTIRGGEAQTIQPGQMVTPAQYVALGQVAATGKQTLILDTAGSASSGFLTMLPQGVSSMSELTIPQGVTVHSIGYTVNNPFQVNGQATVNGALYALQSQAGSTAVLNFESLSVGQNGMISGSAPSNNHILNGVFSSSGMTMNVAGNVNNAGTITTPGTLTINAGGTINNGAQLAATQAVISASTVNLITGAGSLNNSGMIAATVGNVNVATELAKNLTINGSAESTVQALAGDINIGNANETGKVNLTMNGGNYLSQEMNLTSGDGAVEVNVRDLTGTLNIKAGLAHVAVQTNNLQLGDMVLSGDPSFYNSLPNGDIEIAGSLTFNGDDLAIVASRDVKTITGCASCMIDTSGTSGRGGNITIVAGADFSVTTLSGPPQGPDYPNGGTVNSGTPIGPNDANTVLEITGPSASGGKIDFATVPIGGINSSTTATSGSTIVDASGGNVVLVAFAPASAATAPAPGTIALPPSSVIQTGGGTYIGTGAEPGNSGNVLVIAGATSGQSITLGAINTNNTQSLALTSGQSGFISINAAQPIIVGSSCPTCTVLIQAGTLINPSSGSFAPNPAAYQKGNILIGNVYTTYGLQVIGGGSVTVSNITVDLPVPGGPGVVLAAGAGVAGHASKSAGTVKIDGDIHTNGLPLSIIASGNIVTGPNASGIDSGATVGQGGTLVTVAGADTTLAAIGPLPVPYAAITINGVSDTGGSIDLTGASSGGVSITKFSSRYSGGAGGQIIVGAYAYASDSSTGLVSLPISGVTIESGGANLTILAGASDLSPPVGISIGDVDTTGSGTGNMVYVATQQPSGVLTINPGPVTGNFNNSGSTLAVSLASISAGGFLTQHDLVKVVAGKNLTLSGGVDNAANSNPSTVQIWAGVDSSGPTSANIGPAATISITGSITPSSSSMASGNIVNIISGLDVEVSGAIQADQLFLSSSTARAGNLGTSSVPLSTEVNSIKAVTGGDVYISQTGNVTLKDSAAGSVSGTFDLTTTSNGDITIDAPTGIAGHIVNLTAGGTGNIFQGNGFVGGDELTLNAGGDVGAFGTPLQSQALDKLTIISGFSVYVDQTGAVSLQASSAGTAGLFDLKFSGGDLTLNGNLTATDGSVFIASNDTSSLVRTSGTIFADSIHLDVGGSIGASGDSVQVAAVDDLEVGAGADAYVIQGSTASGFNLLASSAGSSTNTFELEFSGGDLRINGGVTVTTGTLKLTGTDASSIFRTAGTLTAENIYLSAGGAIGLDASNRILTAAGDLLSIDAGTDAYVNQTGAFDLCPSGAGASNIFDLTFSGGDLTIYNNVTAGTIKLTATDSTSSIAWDSGMLIADVVRLDTNLGGSIGASGLPVITQAANSLQFISGGDVYVDQAGNSPVSLLASSAGNTKTFDFAFSGGDVTLAGNVSAPGGTVIFTAANDTSSLLHSSTFTISGADITLDTSGGGSIGATGDHMRTSAGSTLTIKSGADAYIDQTGSVSLNPSEAEVLTGTFALNVSGGSLTLNGNIDSQTVDLTVSNNLIYSSGTISGHMVSLTSTGGNIGASGLGNAINTDASILGVVATSLTSGMGNAYVSNATGISLDSNSFGVTNVFQLTANGTISTAGSGQLVGNNLTFTTLTGNIVIASGAALAGQNLILDSAGSITLGDDAIGGATASLKAVDNISGAGTVSGLIVQLDSSNGNIGTSVNPVNTAASSSLSITADSLNAGKGNAYISNTGSVLLVGGNISVTNTFDLKATGSIGTSGSGGVTAGDIILTTLGASTISIGAGAPLVATNSVTLNSGGTVVLGSTVGGGTSVSISAVGVVSGLGTISAPSVSLSSSTGFGSLPARTKVNANQLSINTTGFAYIDALGSILINNSNGDVIDIHGVGNITVNGIIGLPASTSVTLNADQNIFQSNSSGRLQAQNITLTALNIDIGQSTSPIIVNVAPQNLQATVQPGGQRFIQFYSPTPTPPQPQPSENQAAATQAAIALAAAEAAAQQAAAQQAILSAQIATRIATDTTPISITPPPIDQTPLNVAQQNANQANQDTIDGLHVATSESGTFDSANLGQMNSAGLKVEQGNTPNFMILNQGSILFQPPADISVQVKEGIVDIPAGAMAFVMETGNDVSVFDMRDGHKAAVRVRVGGKTITMRPGQQVVLSRFLSSDFDQVNPSRSIAYRNQKTLIANENNVRAYSADFSVPSIMMNVTPLRQMLASDRPADRRAARKLLKNSVVVAQMAPQAPYKTSAQAAAP